MAAAGGINYEERIAAWAYVQLLAAGAVRRLGSHGDWHTTAVWMQAPVPVGDVLVEHSGGGAIFIQAKYRKSSFRFDERPDGELLPVFAAFARQFFSANSDAGKSATPWSRPFDPQRDSLVLVLPPSAGETSIRTASSVLDKIRLAKDLTEAENSFNQAEAEKFTVLCAVARTVITQSSATPQNDVGVHNFLSSIRMLILDVDENGAGAGEAQQVLLNAVLPTATAPQASAVWKKLIAIARDANCKGLRLDIAHLADRLINDGVELKRPSVYREDIQRLQALTQRNLARLKQLAELRVASNQVVAIPRTCVNVLATTINTNRVLIGDPGAGKSGVIYQLCTKLMADNKDTILLLADDLETDSGNSLSETLRIQYDLVDVLMAWIGSGPAYLFIDALDAARDPKIARRLRNAMSDLGASQNRWKIIASIRRFDLKHSPETQSLFAGEPAEGFTDPEFKGISHFCVPPLSENELQFAERKDTSIASLMAAARLDETTKSLMVQPFNLSLACDLMRSGVTVDKIVPVSTKVALLDKFWNYRVEAGGSASAKRVEALDKLANNLVKSLSMGIPKDTSIYDSVVLYDLAELHVLEPGAYANGVLRFAHHLLHDYAIAKLLFRPFSPDQLVSRILDHPELSIYARQSLMLHFDFLWASDNSRKQFWTAAIELVRSSLPLIARILTTECAVARIQVEADFSPLLEMRGNIKVRDYAATLIQYVVSEFLDVSEASHLLKSSKAWTIFGLKLIREFPDHYRQVHMILHRFMDLQGLDNDCRRLINETGRLLAQNRAAQNRPEDRYGIEFITGLKAVCRTADLYPDESRLVLQPILTPNFAAEFGDRVYWQLAQEMKNIVNIAPALVGDFYVAVFANETLAEGWEPLGGRILSMRVQRRDNYRMAEYHLKDEFPAFFDASPLDATRAVVRFFPGFRQMNHPRSSGEADVRESFRFLNQECHIITDFSCIWASDAPHHSDDALVILRHARDGWVKLATKTPVIDLILAEIARKNELAVVWANLIEAGVEAPESLGIRLASLLTQKVILMGMDTHHSAAKLLTAIFPLLGHDQKVAIERTIVGLPTERRKDEPDEGEMELWRGLYLGCIKPDALVTTEAKDLQAKLKQANEIRYNAPPFRSESSFGGSTDWSDYVPGVRKDELQTPVHLEAKEWERKLTGHQNGDHLKSPSSPQDQLWIDLEGAYDFVITRRAKDINPAIADIVWGHLVSLAERMVRAASKPASDQRLSFLKTVFLTAAKDPNPVVSPDTEQHFAEAPSWGSPSPRIDAAEALVGWGREFKFLDDEIRNALRTLLKDTHPAVRFQILGSCNALYDIDQYLMWELINEGVKSETNVAVWGGLLGALDRISPAHPDRVAALIFEFLSRFPRPTESSRNPADTAIGILGALFIRSGHKVATDFVYQMIAEPAKHSHSLSILSQSFRQALAVGLGNEATDFQKQVHTRALDFTLRAVQSAKDNLITLLAQYQDPNSTNKETIASDATAIVKLLDAINMQIFFASGAHDAQSRKSVDINLPPREAFWRDAAPIIGLLVSVESAHIAFHLAETLEYLIPADPEEVFRQLVILVRHANRDAFAQESLAVGVITRIIERYLADYGDIFTNHEDCRKGLIEILDAFAAVGWPEARRLIRNLSRIYR